MALQASQSVLLCADAQISVQHSLNQHSYIVHQIFPCIKFNRINSPQIGRTSLGSLSDTQNGTEIDIVPVRNVGKIIDGSRARVHRHFNGFIATK